MTYSAKQRPLRTASAVSSTAAAYARSAEGLWPGRSERIETIYISFTKKGKGEGMGLIVKDLFKKYGEKVVVDHVSFDDPDDTRYAGEVRR